MLERWSLWMDHCYEAMPWPWPNRTWGELTAPDLQPLPHAVDDFTRYSPTDGNVDLAQVPGDLPRELPQAVTRFAVYHDADRIYVFIQAVKPAQPIPDLASVTKEDFSCVIPVTDETQGLYFGLNQKGEAVGCRQDWSGDSPSAWGAGLFREGYAARHLTTDDGLVACFQIEKRLIAAGIHDDTFRFSVGRCCYATSELLCWGSPIIWTPRADQHGWVRLVNHAEEPRRPALYRLDVNYDPQTETGEFLPTWHGAAPAEGGGTYAGYRKKVTLALNGIEATLPIAPQERARFALPDGWNRLEVLTAMAPPQVVSFQKFSGNRLVVRPPAAVTPPALDEVNAAFRRWHEAHETSYVGDGTWGHPKNRRHCLCHDGVFQAEPYLYAWRYLPRDPVYEQRVRETCARMLEHQQPQGWFPCYCCSPKPKLGEGGAFANGAVGEGLALASALFGEKPWRAASARAADYAWYRWESNQNYAAFVLWHLAALEECDARPGWLTKTQYYATNFVTRDIGLGGAQDGHNYFTIYGNITLKGLARLLQVLPLAHEFRPTLKDKVIRFTNQILSRQQPSGLFAGRNRKYLGFHHPVPGLFFVAAALPELAAELTPALAAMTRAVIEQRHLDEHHDVGPEAGLTLALMARLLKESKT